MRLLPFLGWFRGYSAGTLRADLLAGLTVALVLIPQSMAYAQLAGLPAYFGLYAAFLPPMIASLFGSSRQLATGPVAVVSLMTATALAPLATAGSESFIAYALSLSLLVGLFQFALGVLRLGLVVNFLSHPVVNGFTNAAALIIASSQLSKIFGVPEERAEHYYETVIAVARAALSDTHWPTFGLAVLAFLIMLGLKRVSPRIPNVLVAVVVTTAVSWAAGFERNRTVSLDALESTEARREVAAFNAALGRQEALAGERQQVVGALEAETAEHGSEHPHALDLRHQLELLNLETQGLDEELKTLRAGLWRREFEGVFGESGEARFYPAGRIPEGVTGDGRVWRLRVGNRPLAVEALTLAGGGAVVGGIPQGLPRFGLPRLEPRALLRLFPMAAVICLLGFMEAISIAKAMATRTGQRLDPNQELIGQGLANLAGSFAQSYPVSGSFSRSAVNLQAGGMTGLSNVISSLVVIATLLFFTPVLYHLPQAVLAAIIMMAVVGLLNLSGFVHAWRAQKYDGAIAVITFLCTLLFAPHLDRGILIGVVLSIGLYLLRNIRPETAVLSLHPDGSFRSARRWGLARCERIAVVRFHGSLIFANVSYLEDKVLEQVSGMPHLRHVLIVGNGINELDASGEDTLSLLVDRLREAGYDLSFSGLNDAVLEVLRRTHLYERIGEENFHRSVARALEKLHARTHAGAAERECPLLQVVCQEPTPRRGRLRASAGGPLPGNRV